jgi:fibrillarin-like rRNA methylase
MTHFIKITDKNLEFYLKKKEVSVIVLESDKKEVTVLSTEIYRHRAT